MVSKSPDRPTNCELCTSETAPLQPREVSMLITRPGAVTGSIENETGLVSVKVPLTQPQMEARA